MNAYYQLPDGRVACIDGDCPFPPVHHALHVPNGLVAIGGDLSLNRLLAAYRQGIFPWFSEGEPILWWSPHPRMVLLPSEFKLARSLKKAMHNKGFESRFNTAFRQVMTACSNVPRDGQAGTWITQDIIEAYCRLFEAGFAISSETWLDGQLVGGCYGVKIGRMFYGESMFHHQTDASKVAFAHLVEHLKQSDVAMIDCQMKTSHLASLGAREMDRKVFLTRLSELIKS